MGVVIGVKAQKVKEYSYAILHAYTGDCSNKYNAVYISPIVSFYFKADSNGTVDDYRDEDHQENRLENKWLAKTKNYYSLENHCWYAKARVWQKSYSEVDNDRDKWISFYKDSGVKVHTSYSFGFSLPRD